MQLLSSVGQVDPGPRRRPKSTYIPSVFPKVMALWQLDAFKHRLTKGPKTTIYQALDDTARLTWVPKRLLAMRTVPA